MVCRSTPGNTAITTIARNQTGLHDVQVLSLFHEVRAEAPRDAAAPDPVELQRTLNAMNSSAAGLEGHMATRHHRTLHNNVHRARTAPRPDGRTYYAWRNIQQRATFARAAMESHFSAISNRFESVSPDQVEAAFNTLMQRDHRINGETPRAPEYVPFATSHLPRDERTRYALAMLYAGGPRVTSDPDFAAEVYRIVHNNSDHIENNPHLNPANQCPDCGQFAGTNHTCPTSATTTEDQPGGAFTRHVIDTQTPVEDLTFAPADPEHTEPEPDGLAPWERDLLQGRLQDDPDTTRTVEPAPTPAAPPAREQAPRRSPLRTYRDESGINVRMMNISAIRAMDPNTTQTLDDLRIGFTRNPDGTPTNAMVTGNLTVTNTGLRRTRTRDRYTVAELTDEHSADATTRRSLRCTCPDYRANYDCVHVRQAVEQVTALINNRDAVAVAPAAAMETVAADLREEFDASVAASQAAREGFDTTTEVSYGENMTAFQEAWDEAKAHFDAGETTLPYMYENATNGLGAREGGRSIGIEIEVDFPDDMNFTAKQRVAQEIYDAGLSDSPQVRPWHWRARQVDTRGRSMGGGYTDNPNMWSVEFDRSVDDVGGQRGCEIVSPILYDTPETWRNLKTICDIVERNGGRVTPRTGLHINIGAADFDHTVGNHNRLIGLANAYEDVIVRTAHNPQSGPQHRGRDYCRPMTMPAEGFTSIRQAQRSIDPSNYEGSSHRAMINLDHVPAEGAPIQSSTRVEVRIFDGSIDPGRIQANVKMSLGMVDAAVRGVEVPRDAERAGTHRAANVGANGRMRRLRGEDWERDTASFRRFADTIFARAEDKKQLTYAFAASRWQRR